jgi:hypothetical protein
MTPAQSIVRSWPVPSVSSGRCQAGPVPRRPHTSVSLLRGQKPLGTRLNTTSVTAQTRPLPLLWHRGRRRPNFPRLAAHVSHSSRCIDARHTPCCPMLSSHALMHWDITSPLSRLCWSAPLLAITMPAPSTQRQGPAHRLCFLVPCWHCVRPHLALQLPSLVPRRHIVLAQARLPRGPVQRHYLASSPVLTAYGQTPSASPPPKAAATATSLLRLAAHACTPVTLPPRRAITSLSPSIHRPALPPRNAWL